MIDAEPKDSSHYQTNELKRLSVRNESSFDQHTKQKYFQAASASTIEPISDNIGKMNSLILEKETQGKEPGGKFLNDILKATLFYTKDSIKSLFNDLKEFVYDKKG